MEIGQGMIGRILVVRLDKGEDLLKGITRACEEVGIKCGIVYGVGVLSKARVTTGFTSDDSKVVEVHDENVSISNLIGIISMRENEIHLNVYLTLSKSDGTVISGRALDDNQVNPSVELIILEIQKAKLKRVVKEDFEVLKIYE